MTVQIEAIRRLYYSDDDARAFTREILIANVIIIILFAMAACWPIPWWLTGIALNVPLVRWMLAMHELFHIQPHDSVNPLARLLLIPFSPINVGYAEYRQLHMGHHQHAATEDDPDAFHIGGGHMRSLLGALFFPEGSTLRCLTTSQVKINWLEVLARLVLFVGLATLLGVNFWVVWVGLRVNYALALWIFFHHLHYRHGKYGTFPLPLPKFLVWIFATIYGKPAVYATMHHDVHHRHPRVAAVNLPALAGGE